MKFSTLKLIDDMLSSFVEQAKRDADEATDPYEIEALEELLAEYSRAYNDFKAVNWR